MHEFLEHYGVKGMQWGVRRNRADLRRAAQTYKKGNKKADRLDKKVAKRREQTKRQKKSSAERQKTIDRLKSGELASSDILEMIGNANLVTAGGAIANRTSYRKQYASDQQRNLDAYNRGVTARANRTNLKAAAARQARAGANKAEAILRNEPNLILIDK